MPVIAEVEKSRTALLRESIMESMPRPKRAWQDTGDIWGGYPGVEREPLIVRNALAVKKKLADAPIALWPGQLIAGSFALPQDGVMVGGELPDYATAREKAAAAAYGYSVSSIVGHIVPSYPKLLRKGALGIRDDAVRLGREAQDDNSRAFYRTYEIVMQALAAFAARWQTGRLPPAPPNCVRWPTIWMPRPRARRKASARPSRRSG